MEKKGNNGVGIGATVKLWPGALIPLFITVFLHNYSAYMVIPAVTEATTGALCPGKSQECTIAYYLTGLQQAVIGIGTLVMMPLIGILTDTYGRRVALIVPLILSILPPAILAVNTSKPFVIAYYVLKILTSMFSDGAVHVVALAYAADIIPPIGRAAIFAILSGIGSAAFVSGIVTGRFLPTSITFQVATGVAVLAALYTIIFLPEPVKNLELETKLIEDEKVETNKISHGNAKFLKVLPSLLDMITLIKTSSVFSKVALVAFLDSVGEVGFHAALMYYLKARFHFSNNQFADLLVIMGVAGTTSQLILMPLLVPLIGEEILLSVGLFFSCVHMFLYSVAWSSWVPYIAAMFAVLIVFIHPCLRSIVSKQVGPNDQGTAQGCISGISSSANFIAPLAFTPLTALFQSQDAPFAFPGFSIMCFGLLVMVALFHSLMIWVVPSKTTTKDEKYNNLAA